MAKFEIDGSVSAKDLLAVLKQMKEEAVETDKTLEPLQKSTNEAVKGMETVTKQVVSSISTTAKETEKVVKKTVDKTLKEFTKLDKLMSGKRTTAKDESGKSHKLITPYSDLYSSQDQKANKAFKKEETEYNNRIDSMKRQITGFLQFVSDTQNKFEQYDGSGYTESLAKGLYNSEDLEKAAEDYIKKSKEADKDIQRHIKDREKALLAYNQLGKDSLAMKAPKNETDARIILENAAKRVQLAKKMQDLTSKIGHSDKRFDEIDIQQLETNVRQLFSSMSSQKSVTQFFGQMITAFEDETQPFRDKVQQVLGNVDISGVFQTQVEEVKKDVDQSFKEIDSYLQKLDEKHKKANSALSGIARTKYQNVAKSYRQDSDITKDRTSEDTKWQFVGQMSNWLAQGGQVDLTEGAGLYYTRLLENSEELATFAKSIADKVKVNLDTVWKAQESMTVPSEHTATSTAVRGNTSEEISQVETLTEVQKLNNKTLEEKVAILKDMKHAASEWHKYSQREDGGEWLDIVQSKIQVNGTTYQSLEDCYALYKVIVDYANGTKGVFDQVWNPTVNPDYNMFKANKQFREQIDLRKKIVGVRFEEITAEDVAKRQQEERIEQEKERLRIEEARRNKNKANQTTISSINDYLNMPSNESLYKAWESIKSQYGADIAQVFYDNLREDMQRLLSPGELQKVQELGSEFIIKSLESYANGDNKQLFDFSKIVSQTTTSLPFKEESSVSTDKAQQEQKELQEELGRTDKIVQKILYHYGLLSSRQGGKKSHQFGDEITAYKEGVRNGNRGWADGTGTYVTNDVSEFNGMASEDFKKFFALDASKLKLYEAHIEEEAEKFYNFQHKLEQFVLAAGSGYSGFDKTISNTTSESLYKEAKEIFVKYPEFFNETFKDFEAFNSFIDKMIGLVKESGINENGLESKNAKKLLEFKQKYGVDDIKTRFLKELGFQGTDLSGTSYGGIQSGSVIFDIETAPILSSAKTIQELLNNIGVTAEDTKHKVSEVIDKKQTTTSLPLKEESSGQLALPIEGVQEASFEMSKAQDTAQKETAETNAAIEGQISLLDVLTNKEKELEDIYQTSIKRMVSGVKDQSGDLSLPWIENMYGFAARDYNELENARKIIADLKGEVYDLKEVSASDVRNMVLTEVAKQAGVANFAIRELSDTEREYIDSGFKYNAAKKAGNVSELYEQYKKLTEVNEYIKKTQKDALLDYEIDFGKKLTGRVKDYYLEDFKKKKEEAKALREEILKLNPALKEYAKDVVEMQLNKETKKLDYIKGFSQDAFVERFKSNFDFVDTLSGLPQLIDENNKLVASNEEVIASEEKKRKLPRKGSLTLKSNQETEAIRQNTEAVKENAQAHEEASQKKKNIPQALQFNIEDLDEKELKKKISDAEKAIDRNYSTAEGWKEKLPLMKEALANLEAQRKEQERIKEEMRQANLEIAKQEAMTKDYGDNVIRQVGKFDEDEQWRITNRTGAVQTQDTYYRYDEDGNLEENIMPLKTNFEQLGKLVRSLDSDIAKMETTLENNKRTIGSTYDPKPLEDMIAINKQHLQTLLDEAKTYQQVNGYAADYQKFLTDRAENLQYINLKKQNDLNVQAAKSEDKKAKKIEQSNAFLERQKRIIVNMQQLYDRDVNPNTDKYIKSNTELGDLRTRFNSILSQINGLIGTEINQGVKDNLLNQINDFENQRKSYTKKAWGATDLTPTELDVSKDIVKNNFDRFIVEAKMAGSHTAVLVNNVELFAKTLNDIKGSDGVKEAKDQLKEFRSELQLLNKEEQFKQNVDKENNSAYKEQAKVIKDYSEAHAKLNNLYGKEIKQGKSSELTVEIEAQKQKVNELKQKAKEATIEILKMFRSGAVSEQQKNDAIHVTRNTNIGNTYSDKLLGAIKKDQAIANNIQEQKRMANELSKLFAGKEFEGGIFTNAKIDGNNATLTFLEVIGDQAIETKVHIDDIATALANLQNGSFDIGSYNTDYKTRNVTTKDYLGINQNDAIQGRLDAYNQLYRTEEKYQELQRKVNKKTASKKEVAEFNELVKIREYYNDILKDSLKLTQEEQAYYDKIGKAEENKAKEKYDKHQANLIRKNEARGKVDDARINSPEIQNALTSTQQLMNDINVKKQNMSGFSSIFDNAQKEVEELNAALRAGSMDIDTYTKNVQSIANGLNNTIGVLPSNIKDVENAMKQFAKTNLGAGAEIGNFNGTNNTLQVTLNKGRGVVQELTLAYSELSGQVNIVKDVTKQSETSFSSFFKSLKGRARALTQYLMTFASFYRVVAWIRQGVSVVKELDTALTNMRKVSDESVQSLKEFQKVSFDIGQSIGATAAQIQESTADFMRIGYNLQEASALAEDANIYANVGDMEIGEATEHMISSIKAWESEFNSSIEASEALIDRYNEIGNNFAISSADIGSAMERSAAALKAGGNTLNESLGLITAGEQNCLKNIEIYFYRTHLNARTT